MEKKDLKYDNGFRNKSYKSDNEKVKYSSYSKLFIRLDSDAEREHTNQQDWERTIIDERVGKYGKRFQLLMKKGKWDYTTLKATLDVYPIKQLLKDTKEYWEDDLQLSELQELAAIDNETERQYRKNQMIKAWRNEINDMNNIIENENHYNRSMQKLAIDEEKEYQDKCAIFFADLWSTITYDSQHIIKRFECKRGEVKLGRYKDRDVEVDDVGDVEDEESTIYSSKNEVIDYDTAQAEGNWIWLIYATRETHISVIKCDNEWESREQMLNAEKRVSSMKYKGGSFYHFLDAYKNAIEVALRLGSTMTDIDAVLHIVSALPDDLFANFKKDFANPRMRKEFSSEYDQFEKELKERRSTIASESRILNWSLVM